MMTLVRGELPSGTVTFVFTDVEGSTTLLQELGAERYAEALAEHRRILREAFGAHGGVEVDTQGDAFFVAFTTAEGAREAAAEALEGLADGRIRVRVGIHTGTPHLAEEGYVGVDVHRAARIASCGHGGQVLISASTASLLGADGLHDLGEHRLKDLSAPERLYQLGDDEFPPLRSLYRTNLPVASTPFLGRERELAEVFGMLARRDVRLLTLTGPGGTGKTRLAAQAAGLMSDAYPHGVWWVPLAPVRDPALVLATAAQAVGAKHDLAEHIADRAMLLLFDNLEHLLEAAPELAALLVSCPRVDLLVTSREPLHVTSEQEYPVPPLAHEEGVGFFLARARAVKPDFQADEAVSEICRRLDDLPLALELAAARVSALSAGQILGRLEQRLPLLTGGARDLPERQRTLRATIDWSHNLLSLAERRIFARLSVFSGRFTLESAEEVCDADLDALQSLVEKSLLRFEANRYRMLATIREYGLERLHESGEQDPLGRRHAQHVLARAEQRRVVLYGPDQRQQLDATGEELDDIRAALAFLIERGDSDSSLRLAVSLERFWLLRAPGEGRHWLDLALAKADRVPLELKAAALRAAGLTARSQGKYGDSERFNEQSLELYRQVGEPADIAETLRRLAVGACARADYARARARCVEALELARQSGSEPLLAAVLHNLGEISLRQGMLDLARAELDEALETARSVEDPYLTAQTLSGLGDVALEQGDLELARRRYREGFELGMRVGRLFCAYALASFAAVAAGAGDCRRAGFLWGGLEALEEEREFSLLPADRERYLSFLQPVRGPVFDTAVAEGRTAGVDTAVQWALVDLGPPPER